MRLSFRELNLREWKIWQQSWQLEELTQIYVGGLLGQLGLKGRKALEATKKAKEALLEATNKATTVTEVNPKCE